MDATTSASDDVTFLAAAEELGARRRTRERLRTDYLDCVSHDLRSPISAIPVVMMTGYAPGVVMAAFARDPGVRYVGKPIHFDELLRALDAT